MSEQSSSVCHFGSGVSFRRLSSFTDHTLEGHVMETAIVADQFECQLKCLTNNSCKSLNLHPSADSKAKHICELNNKTRHMAPKKFKPKKGSTYYGSVKVCIATRAIWNYLSLKYKTEFLLWLFNTLKTLSTLGHCVLTFVALKRTIIKQLSG